MLSGFFLYDGKKEMRMYVRYRDFTETMDQGIICSNNKRNGANKRAEDCTALAIFHASSLRGGHAPVIGLYSDYEKDENGAYLFTAGQLVDQRLAQDAKEIPGSTYARFQTRKGPIEEVVFETWRQIWSWDQRYLRTYTGDFEWYDERSIDPKEAQIDIYIAVDEKIVAKTNAIS